MKDFVCKNCSNPFSSKKACKSRTPVFCSRKCAAVFNTAQQSVKDKMSKAKLGVTPWNKGVKMWEGKEHPRGTLGKSNPNTSGEKSRFWKGGVSTENERQRKSKEYRKWRSDVFQRDDYTCQECNKKGGRLNADHIKPFAYFKDLRFELSNGRTLCVKCHRKTDTYGLGAKKYAAAID